jgi:pimeloyl-ACP methyl ester carboxylesterase
VIAEVIERLELDNVTLVGNDTGGELCQMVVTSRPDHIGRLVLTSCDYRDNFPPKLFRFLKVLGRAPVLAVLALAPMRWRLLRRLPIGFGWLAKRPIEPAAEDTYLLHALTNPAVRADLSRFIRSMDPCYTNEAADRLGKFAKPLLIAWSRHDRVFPPAHARQLAAELPAAQLAWIDDSYAFSPEDQPQMLAELIANFACGPSPSA